MVTPADQTVVNNAAFATVLQQAIQAAADSTIVILGVKSTQPETGYGYIQASVEPSSTVETVQRFVENLICKQQSNT